jgi:hypothetical protein
MKLIQWALNGKEKVSQASIFDLNGMAHKPAVFKIRAIIGIIKSIIAS